MSGYRGPAVLVAGDGVEYSADVVLWNYTGFYEVGDEAGWLERRAGLRGWRGTATAPKLPLSLAPMTIRLPDRRSGTVEIVGGTSRGGLTLDLHGDGEPPFGPAPSGSEALRGRL